METLKITLRHRKKITINNVVLGEEWSSSEANPFFRAEQKMDGAMLSGTFVLARILPKVFRKRLMVASRDYVSARRLIWIMESPGSKQNSKKPVGPTPRLWLVCVNIVRSRWNI